MSAPAQRRERLARARLYFVTDAGIDLARVREALGAGVDMLQLRDRSLGDGELLEAAAPLRAACEEHGALFWINDRPDLALRAGADGVHVGQDDTPVKDIRARFGEELLIGLSTHSREQFERACGSGADLMSVGPVWETPTKPGRPPTGLEYVRHVAALRPVAPWFAIGGIDPGNAALVAAAGAERIVVVRALREARDPAVVAARLLGAMEGGRVGAAQ